MVTVNPLLRPPSQIIPPFRRRKVNKPPSLLDYHLKNYGDRGGCSLPRPIAFEFDPFLDTLVFCHLVSLYNAIADSWLWIFMLVWVKWLYIFTTERIHNVLKARLTFSTKILPPWSNHTWELQPRNGQYIWSERFRHSPPSSLGGVNVFP